MPQMKLLLGVALALPIQAYSESGVCPGGRYCAHAAPFKTIIYKGILSPASELGIDGVSMQFVSSPSVYSVLISGPSTRLTSASVVYLGGTKGWKCTKNRVGYTCVPR